MSRQRFMSGPLRAAVTPADGASFFPAAPEVRTSRGGVLGDQPPAGVFVCDGCSLIICDVLLNGAFTGAGVVDILAWVPQLADAGQQGWVLDTTFAVATGANLSEQRFRTPVGAWASRFAYARVTTLGTGGTSYTVALSGALQDT